jgi:hypothetical protein
MAQSNLAKIIPIRAGMAGGGNTTVDQLDKATKETAEKQLKTDEKLVTTNEKLVTNLEKLASAIKSGAITASSSSGPNYKDGGVFDQRSVKDQAKDGLLGRMGSDGKRDQFDKDSLKYKFGSLRGLSKVGNFVKDDSFVGNLIGRREDKLKRADTLMKMNPQMKNLKQFKGDDEKVRQYYIKQHEEQFAPAQAKAQSEKYKLDSMLQSGINPDELAKSVGGKRQIKAVEAAQADELSKDKFRKQEVKGVLDGMSGAVGIPSNKQSADSNVIPFPTQDNSSPIVSGGLAKEGELENIRLMGSQNEMISKINENTASQPIYLEEWREETKRKVEYDAQLLQAVKEGGSGGGGGGIMDMAGDMLGKGKGKLAGGASKMGGLLKAGGGLLSKAAVPLTIGASIIGGGVTAYKGFTGASEKEAKGEITKEQATVEKGGAVGEGTGVAVGGAVGALKGAAVGAAIGSVVPVLGTAVGGLIGAAVGGLGGSFFGGKIGKFVGETGGKIVNAFSGSNPDKSNGVAKVQSMGATPNAQAPDKDVVFAREKLERDQVGGNAITGYEKGYNLSGKKEDVDAAKAAYAAFDAASAAGDAAGMDAAANKFKALAGKIQSPEYKAQMKAISDKQNARKGKGAVEKAKAEAPSADKAKAITGSATPQSAPKPASPAPAAVTQIKTELDKKVEDARQNALADGASPEEANSIAEKMKKYGNVISAGQGRGDVYQPVPTSANVKPQTRGTADKVAEMTTDVASAKDKPPQVNNSSSSVTNTNVKQSNTQAIKPPIRNQDSSFYNMVTARYVY